MKTPMSVALFAVALLVAQRALRADEAAAGNQLLIKIRLLEGDPMAIRETGTAKVLAEPCLVTQENRPFSFFAGGEVMVGAGEVEKPLEFGRRIEGKAGAVHDGRVRLDLTLTHTTIAERSDKRVQLHSQTTRTITTVRLGETVKFPCGRGDAGKRAWVELRVDEFMSR